jgi:ABC-2 type transport system ATP-binding protein
VTSDEPIIETRALRKKYRGAPMAAVDGLNLAVPRGQVFGFLGPNGAGKTTTIGMLLGNVFPTSGGGRVLGKSIGDRDARRRIGYLPEKFQFHDFLTATEFLRLHGTLYGMARDERERRIPEVLDLVGLGGRKKSRLREFSKGMQQRAGLAQAILHEPDLVILDEPTSALDPLGRRAVRDLILHLKARGTTVLLNSHLLSEIERTCDTVAIIRSGRVRRQGTVAEITVPATRVTIELETLSPALSDLLARFGTIEPVEASAPGTSAVRVSSLNEARVPELVGTLVGAGARIRAVVPSRETLEDAFVRLMDEPDDEPASAGAIGGAA